MNLDNSSQVTLALLVAFGLFVVYTRLRNWLDSNVPIIFYVLLILYMQANDGAVPFWLICTGCGLALILRFEFMNSAFSRGIKFLELGALAAMLYLSVGMLMH